MELQEYKGGVGSRAERPPSPFGLAPLDSCPVDTGHQLVVMVMRLEARWGQEGLTHISGSSECSRAKREPALSFLRGGCPVGELLHPGGQFLEGPKAVGVLACDQLSLQPLLLRRSSSWETRH